MNTITFTFDDTVDMSEVEATLLLSLIAAESLVGATRLRLADCHAIDLANRTVTIDESSAAGEALSLIFAGYALREFGSDQVRVGRADTTNPNNPEEIQP